MRDERLRDGPVRVSVTPRAAKVSRGDALFEQSGDLLEVTLFARPQGC
ncbi:MAG: hypothetical protein H6722_21575 [Sandaracinus sp.]|nr:hypothetical protein [Sandaracinus sp.]